MSMPKILGVIPSRYASSRLPGKPLLEISGKTMVEHVYRRAMASGIFFRVVVATDDRRVYEAVEKFGGDVIMTSPDHPDGSSRVAEVARGIDTDYVINIQGDEPLLDPHILDELVAPFAAEPDVAVCTLAMPVEPERARSPNQVKVVAANNGDALYFSRSRLPFDRDGGEGEILGHIGLYAFRMRALERFVNLPQSPLEKREKLEQLRFLENGVPIRVVRVEGYEAHGVDTPEDLETIRELLAEHTCKSCVR